MGNNIRQALYRCLHNDISNVNHDSQIQLFSITETETTKFSIDLYISVPEFGVLSIINLSSGRLKNGPSAPPYYYIKQTNLDSTKLTSMEISYNKDTTSNLLTYYLHFTRKVDTISTYNISINKNILFGEFNSLKSEEVDKEEETGIDFTNVLTINGESTSQSGTYHTSETGKLDGLISLTADSASTTKISGFTNISANNITSNALLASNYTGSDGIIYKFKFTDKLEYYIHMLSTDSLAFSIKINGMATQIINELYKKILFNNNLMVEDGQSEAVNYVYMYNNQGKAYPIIINGVSLAEPTSSTHTISASGLSINGINFNDNEEDTINSFNGSLTINGVNIYKMDDGDTNAKITAAKSSHTLTLNNLVLSATSETGTTLSNASSIKVQGIKVEPSTESAGSTVTLDKSELNFADGSKINILGDNAKIKLYYSNTYAEYTHDGIKLNNGSDLFTVDNTGYVKANKYEIYDSDTLKFSADNAGYVKANKYEIYDSDTLKFSADNTGKVQAVGYYSLSDKRLKENIRNTNINYKDIISNINLKEFNFINDDKTMVGVIAQELQTILPEKYKESVVSTTNDYLSVNEGKLGYYTLGAVKELIEENKLLKQEIAELRQMIEEIKK